MRLAVAIGVISLLAAAYLIRSAIGVGFGIFVGPIVLAEAVFLGALYALWRGLGGEPDLDSPQPARPAPDRRAPAEPKPRPAGPAAPQVGLGGRSLVGRTGG